VCWGGGGVGGFFLAAFKAGIRASSSPLTANRRGNHPGQGKKPQGLLQNLHKGGKGYYRDARTRGFVHEEEKKKDEAREGRVHEATNAGRNASTACRGGARR